MRAKTTSIGLCLVCLLSSTAISQTFTPPLSPVRAMAEWEELQSVVIAWTTYSNTLTEIVRAARQECNVIICCNNLNTVTAAKNKLIASGVDISSNVSFFIANYNTVWMRDYGPNCVYTHDVDSLQFIDWLYNWDRPEDNAIAGSIGQLFQVPVYATANAPYDLVNVGGNFMSDGMGTAFASKLILINNDQALNAQCNADPDDTFGTSDHTEAAIDNIMNAFLGIDRFVKLDLLPFDCNHHIDMHMKLLDEETLMVGQYPEGIADGPQIEANIQYVLDHFKTPFGNPYRIVRIPMPPVNGLYPDSNAAYRTYTNALFVNKTILVPNYEEQYDTIAMRIWKEAMPGYNVVGIDCNNSIPQRGAVHCLTKEVGASEPLRIVHQVLPCQLHSLTPNGYEVKALLQHRSGIDAATVFFRTDPSGPWQSASMSPSPASDDEWMATIPTQAIGSTVYYYIHAVAGNGKSMTRPMTAPNGFWHFCIKTGTGTEDLRAELKDIYPNPASSVAVLPVQLQAKETGRLLVFNSMGQLVATVFEGTFPAGASNYFLDVEKLPSGHYWVELQTAGQLKTKKLVVTIPN